MAQLKTTSILGNAIISGNVVASKIIKIGGSNQQVMLADGSVKSLADFGIGPDGTLKAVTVKEGDVLEMSNEGVLGTKYASEQVTTVTCGGLDVGSNVNGWTVKQILDKLLYKYQSPSISSSLSTSASSNNSFIKGTYTLTGFTATVTAGSKPTKVKSATLTFNGEEYTSTTVGKTVAAFTQQPVYFSGLNFSATANPTSVSVPSAAVTIVLEAANENGTDTTLTVTRSSTSVYFTDSYYYVGKSSQATGTDYTVSSSITSDSSSKLSGTPGKELSLSLTNQVFTLAIPKAWGTTLKVFDGASNPVEGVFRNVGTKKITNVNGYEEEYIVWKADKPATGTIKYFFKITT